MTKLRRHALIIFGSLGALGCSIDGLLNSDRLPKNVSDPALTESPVGALSAYNNTVAQFRQTFGGNYPAGFFSVIAATGLLTDELRYTSFTADGADGLDRRVLPEGTQNMADGTYGALGRTRGQAQQAIGLVVRHLPGQLALAGHLYALQGYSELFLAELFCSGIPLSVLDSVGGYTYRPGSGTADVLAHAIALFDTALTLAGDSVRVMDMARVGRARALLALGQYADAAAGVTEVADAFRYNVIYTTFTPTDAVGSYNFAGGINSISGTTYWRRWAVPDSEGGNGLGWRSSGDPRSTLSDLDLNGFLLSHPDKYNIDGSSPIVLASGVEARLIEAEAALQANAAGGQWLAKLNALRTDGTYDLQPTADPNDDPAAMDTLWHPGTGGSAGLRPLIDPGTDTGRVNLLFRERGFWLFLTGHRQGDLRRLIRQYGILYPGAYTQSTVYPVGSYLGTGVYGHDVTAPIPQAERDHNPRFTGCISRDA